MKTFFVVSIVLMLISLAYAGQGTHWGYFGAEGPEHWGSLDPEFTACSEGQNQSPINLTGFIESDLTPVGIHYEAGGKGVINNGHQKSR